MSEAKRKANTDTTYCASEECANKCDIHMSNYVFDEDKNYCWMEYCLEHMEGRR